MGESSKNDTPVFSLLGGALLEVETKPLVRSAYGLALGF